MWWCCEKNKILSLKLDFVLNENESLRNKIVLIQRNWIWFLRKIFPWKLIYIFMFAMLHHLVYLLHAPPLLLLLKMIYVVKKRVLIVWAPLWANVSWTTHGWNLCFERNKFLLCMYTNHGIHMLPTFTPITLCMLMCTPVHIVT